METYHIDKDITVIGNQVPTFPNGIGESFEALMHKLPGGMQRGWYGVSYMTPDNRIVYKTMAEEKEKDEAQKFHLETYTIEKGDYMATEIKDWKKNLSCIKDVFEEMMRDKRTDKTKPCIEWYKTEDEMLCLIKAA